MVHIDPVDDAIRVPTSSAIWKHLPFERTTSNIASITVCRNQTGWVAPQMIGDDLGTRGCNWMLSLLIKFHRNEYGFSSVRGWGENIISWKGTLDLFHYQIRRSCREWDLFGIKISSAWACLISGCWANWDSSVGVIFAYFHLVFKKHFGGLTTSMQFQQKDVSNKSLPHVPRNWALIPPPVCCNLVRVCYKGVTFCAPKNPFLCYRCYNQGGGQQRRQGRSQLATVLNFNI